MDKHSRKANYLRQNEKRGAVGANRGFDSNLTPRQRKRINKKLKNDAREKTELPRYRLKREQ